jgi:hypothetical protein
VPERSAGLARFVREASKASQHITVTKALSVLKQLLCFFIQIIQNNLNKLITINILIF